jgi:heparin binding hemagglutinin HbhA
MIQQPSRQNPTSPDKRIELASGADELRRAADGYRGQAIELYNSLIERGEAALEQLRKQPRFEERRTLAERAFRETVELTQQALDNLASHIRAVGEHAAMLIDPEVPKRAQKAAVRAKTAAATEGRKTPSKRPTRRDL